MHTLKSARPSGYPELKAICKNLRQMPVRVNRSTVASTEVERHTGVDVEDVPSKDWGWSGDAPRLWHAVGIFLAVFLLAMLRGNHVGHVEDWFLIAFATVVLVFVGRDLYLRRRGLSR
jgi:hypothetical protein